MADNSRIDELRRRVQLDPASIAFAALAEEYRRAGHYEEAIATCQAGLQRHPAYLSARVTLGRSLLEIGRYDEAREELEHVLRAAPENLAAIRGLAEIHHRMGELPEALEQYRSAPAPAAARPGEPQEEAARQAPAEEAAAPFALTAAHTEQLPPLQLSAAAPATPPPQFTVAEIPPEAESPLDDAVPPAFVAPPDRTPITPVKLSSVELELTGGASPAIAPAGEPPDSFAAPTQVPATFQSSGDDAIAAVEGHDVRAPSRVPHPDEAALPALEGFLAAIVRARQSRPSARSVKR